MWLFHADASKSFHKDLKPQDWAGFYFSVVLVPVLVIVFTIVAFATLGSRFGHSNPSPSPFHVMSDPEQRLLPAQAFQALATTPLQTYSNT